MRPSTPYVLLLLSVFIPSGWPVLAQESDSAPASAIAAPGALPKLTPEQRQVFAQARERATGDAEYQAAAQRVREAQKAADRIFYAKLLQAAPELRDYIQQLQRARGVSQGN